MKSLLMVAALLAGLAAPAQAEDATPAPPPQPEAQAALAPAQDAPPSDSLPHLTAPEPEAAMSAPLDANAPPPARSGCSHAKTTEYLTN